MHAALLETLAEEWGQESAFHWLDCFLSADRLRWKQPLLILITRRDADRNEFSASTVCGAALFFEYRRWNLGSGFCCTDEPLGQHTVIAPAGSRTEMTRIAVDTLLKRGAQLVAATFRGEGTAGHANLDDVKFEERETRDAVRELSWREVPRHLDLAATYEETLARLGKSTRANLRYYRKRLLKRGTYEYVENVGDLVDQAGREALNRNAINPVDMEQFVRRWERAQSDPRGFLVGLRTAQGDWLSLIGGWREETTTVLNWQVNASGHDRDSLSTVMRSFFLENEINRGAKRLIIDGGTTSSLSHSFQKDVVGDLVVQRRSWRARLIVFARGKFGVARFAIPGLYEEAPSKDLVPVGRDE